MSSDWRIAYSVHVLTASGAAFAMLALIAAVERAWSEMFAWLILALIIDGIDGPIARRLNVAAVLPRWSGDTLDLVVDFLTYVFVPAFAIARCGLMPNGMGVLAAIAIVVSGALYFADREMKTDDNYFRGFPGLWNAAAFYLILLAPPAWLAFVVIAVLVALTFATFPFLHPLRVKTGRSFNIGVLAVGAVFALIAIARNMAPGAIVTVALCVIAFYLATVGVWRRNGVNGVHD